ncbi:MAG: TIGR04066 family peptide maturation system protein [Tepidibacter sp.]|uniref:TIGR04066 family peptide maturation system protein n=1 Tax=Tepidibacter sp. TaxID=2529387 RepID=UPI0025D6579F|nr:TIGR04066 family peptide maturation system protein [Tepidibacter sp.]MCT4508888.1 TIGR04066 family peptide maturation system protein [Tepidibacter sp.]
MKKLAIYPFDIESIQIAKYKEMLPNYEIVAAVSPPGWGLNNRDISYTDLSEPIGISVQNNLNDIIKDIDGVIFVDSFNDIDFYEDIYSNMKICAYNNKIIVDCIRRKDNEKKMIKEFLYNESKNYINYNEEYEHLNDLSLREIEEINVPVIFVCGLDEETNKFDIQMNIRKFIIDNQYRVSQIGTKTYSDIFGFHRFPDFMYYTHLSEVDKILRFNQYIKDIEKNENPDVIIIGIPEGINPASEIFNNQFGILCYEVSKAVNPDFAIISLPYFDYDLNFFNEIQNISFYKYGFMFDYFNISNARFDYVNSKQFNKRMYTRVEKEKVNKIVDRLRQKNIPVMNIFEKKYINSINEEIIRSLTSNTNISII